MAAQEGLLSCTNRFARIPQMTASDPPPASTFLALPDAAAGARLQEALARLSPLQRRVVQLHLRHGLDAAGIAAQLEAAPAAVAASLAFATSQLRVQLSDPGQEGAADAWIERCRVLLGAPLDAVARSDSSPSPAAVGQAQACTQPGELGGPAQARASEVDRPAPPSARPRSAPVTLGLWPRLPAALALLVLGVGLTLGWQAWRASRVPAAPAVRSGPQRMPPPSAPEAPLTAPDFLLVLLRQQHPDLLENLEFEVWLAEQEALR